MFSPSLMGTTIIVFCDFVYCYYVIICKIHTPPWGIQGAKLRNNVQLQISFRIFSTFLPHFGLKCQVYTTFWEVIPCKLTAYDALARLSAMHEQHKFFWRLLRTEYPTGIPGTNARKHLHGFPLLPRNASLHPPASLGSPCGTDPDGSLLRTISGSTATYRAGSFYVMRFVFLQGLASSENVLRFPDTAKRPSFLFAIIRHITAPHLLGTGARRHTK